MHTQLHSPLFTATINHLGAELSSMKHKAGPELIWQADPAVWPRHAPVLFPIVGRLKNNSFVLNEQAYSLGQHGFARDRQFELLAHTGSACTFQLRADEASIKIYPFDFIFQIHYTLENNRLDTTYTITNPSQKALLFSVGAHPGFNCPLLPGEAFEDYYLEFERSDYKIAKLADGLRTGETRALKLAANRLFLSQSLFDNDALVFEQGQVGRISLCSQKTAHKVTMHCEGWPYFGIWAKKGNAQFICLEPWYGIADRAGSSQALLQKDGIIKLGANDTFSCSFSISIG